MSYEEVSDVEEGLDWKSEETVVALARQRYPQANSDVEALFLGRLDDAIENFTPEIRIPRLGIDKFASEDGARTSFAEVLNSLKLPTSALVITVSSAVISILSNNPLVKIAFPYFSCILTFLSAVPSIRERFFAKASSLFAQFDSMKSRVEEAIDRVASKSFKLLHTTESAMDKALAPINAKLTAITQIESMLKQVKPDIDIPDPFDVKRSFDGFNEKLRAGFSSTRNAIDVSRSLPTPFQSMKQFELYIVMPYLALMLAIQLFIVYTTSTRRGNFPDEKTSQASEQVDDLHLILSAIHTYITAVVQIVLVFLLTQARSLLFFLNKEIDVFESNINKELQRTVGGVFEDIFQRGFKLVKSKFLKLLSKMNKLDEPLEKLKGRFPGAFANQELSELGSELKINAAGKLKKKGDNIFEHLIKFFGKK